MKITEIETIPLRLPFAHTFTISQGPGREFIDTLIVRVHTDQDLVGIGETQAWRRQGSAETIWNLVRTIKDYFEPAIVGRSPFDIAGILKTLDATLSNTLYPQAAVADALYDIAGKAVGLAWAPASAAREDAEIMVRVDGRPARARVTGQAFYDPEGARLRM